MGSQSKIDLAYIAGFLDGDGSLMLQIKRRKDGTKKFRFMSTICFYQDSNHEEFLHWIKNILGIGYLTQRDDGMSELRINGFKQVKDIIKNLLPFIKFKKNQANAIYEATSMMSSKILSRLTKQELLKIVDLMLIIQKHNYKSRSKKTKKELIQLLDLTP
ncbi:MAG: LAGLIDADG family homing endonuclease [Candidatus Yanofskybacteria bacterium]|nr:LAGLIDADG family homing endonuclease [Candidatus Yanofskybacteria bacterium]